MKIVLCRDQDEMAELVAEKVLAALAAKPGLVLGLCTGSTPIPVYERLARAVAAKRASFKHVHTFNLDEYLDLPADHPQSYRTFMRTHLFDRIDLDARNTHFPPAEGKDIEARCELFERRIKDLGGIDVMLLGIGRNGHIGFNEPTSSLASRTRVKTLTDRTLEDNARFYAPGEPQPRLAVTMGIGTILDCRTILLQAAGPKKAEAIRMTVEGPVSSFFPASALQLHPHVTGFLDPEASSHLTMRGYYEKTRAYELELRAAGRL